MVRYMLRDDGTATPLVPADELPTEVELAGLAKSIKASEVASNDIVGYEKRTESSLSVRVCSLPAPSFSSVLSSAAKRVISTHVDESIHGKERAKRKGKLRRLMLSEDRIFDQGPEKPVVRLPPSDAYKGRRQPLQPLTSQRDTAVNTPRAVIQPTKREDNRGAWHNFSHRHTLRGPNADGEFDIRTARPATQEIRTIEHNRQRSFVTPNVTPIHERPDTEEDLISFADTEKSVEQEDLPPRKEGGDEDISRCASSQSGKGEQSSGETSSGPEPELKYNYLF